MSNGHHELHEQLAAIVGEQSLVEGQDLLSYSQDYSPFPPVVPGIAVRPGTVEEVASVMRLANSTRTPVVVRGGGASLTGFPDAGDGRFVILDTKRLNRIIEIDETNFTVSAECGIIVHELEDAVARKGLFVHTVTVPGRLTTLGGVLSGVVGGGLPTDGSAGGTDGRYVLGLKVVLPQGRLLSTGAGGCNVKMNGDYMRGGNGPDLTGVFIGDGGILGVKVGATLQISPSPPFKRNGAGVFASFKDAWNVLLTLTGLPRVPFTKLLVRDGGRFFLYYTVCADSQEELGKLEEVVGRACLENNAREEFAPEPLSNEDVLKMHTGLISFIARKSEFPQTYAKIRGYITDRMEKQHLRERGIDLISLFRPNARNGVYCVNYVVYDPSDAAGVSAALGLLQDGYRLVVDLGASPEPHQGFSSKVIGSSWSPEFREVITGMKAVVDPNHILNPGLWNL